MLIHILLMNAVAPLLAWALCAPLSRQPRRWHRLLFPAAAAQLAVLWGWHAPPVLDAAMRSGSLHVAMQVSLLLSATWFWSAVFSTRENLRWRAILALLVTSKLFCLLGVLLVFAPRVLYFNLGAGTGHGMPASSAALADQQLAGLLMLVACPVTYILAGIVIAARWLSRMEVDDPSGSHWQNVRHAA